MAEAPESSRRKVTETPDYQEVQERDDSAGNHTQDVIVLHSCRIVQEDAEVDTVLVYSGKFGKTGDP
ncbi:hypothetical protein BDZ91DRAFT_715600 [Kalaharituber pfeilii]|nr:hypothetical protein BDZ91DRAFT_715600 [Kalaharituber pfeilii]